jgi:hypothetical protein
MKKIFLSLVGTLFLLSCATYSSSRHGISGVIEDAVYVNHHYRYKVWCEKKLKYYNVKSDTLYQIGDEIWIKK